MMPSLSGVAFKLSRAAVLCVLSLNLASCGQALLTAPVDSTMRIIVNPSFISKDGDTATVSVIIIEPAGTPVPDGTVVQFFTTLGKIQEQAKTNDGVARVNLISDARSGTALITAFSGAVTADAETITIGGTRPSQIFTGLITQKIDLKLGETIGRFKATVLDDKGNPVQGIPVRFSVIDDPTTDRILETADVITNNNGEAIGSVQTKRTTAGTIKVRAQVLSATPLSAEISIPVID